MYSSSNTAFSLNAELFFLLFELDAFAGALVLFFSLDLNMSFGLASAEAKNKISHRGRAILKLAETLKEIAK